MRKILLILGIALNVTSLVLSFAINFNTFLIAVFCISALCIVYGVFLNNRSMLKIITRFITCILAITICFNIFLYNYGQNDNVTYKEDALIVLGAGVVGERPSFILERRLNAAFNYYEKNPDAIIIVSGGQGPKEDITEALAMERYLTSRGVSPEKIIREEQAKTTFENISFSKNVIDDLLGSDYTTAIATSDFHVFRATLIAKNLGLNSTHIHGKMYKRGIPANYLRETIAIIFQVILKRGA